MKITKGLSDLYPFDYDTQGCDGEGLETTIEVLKSYDDFFKAEYEEVRKILIEHGLYTEDDIDFVRTIETLTEYTLAYRLLFTLQTNPNLKEITCDQLMAVDIFRDKIGSIRPEVLSNLQNVADKLVQNSDAFDNAADADKLERYDLPGLHANSILIKAVIDGNLPILVQSPDMLIYLYSPMITEILAHRVYKEGVDINGILNPESIETIIYKTIVGLMNKLSSINVFKLQSTFEYRPLDIRSSIRKHMYLIIYREVRNEIEKAIRNSKFEHELPIDLFTHEQDEIDDRIALWQIVGQLHPQYQSVLQLRFFEDYTFRELGRLCGKKGEIGHALDKSNRGEYSCQARCYRTTKRGLSILRTPFYSRQLKDLDLY